MKKHVKKVVLGMLMVSALLGGMLSGQVMPASAADEPDNPTIVVSSSTSTMLSDVQYKKYMSYLTQEYAPELTTEWGKAIEDRQSIQPVVKVDGTVKFEGSGDVLPEDLKVELDDAELTEGTKVGTCTVSDIADDGSAPCIVTITSSTGNSDEISSDSITVCIASSATDDPAIQDELDQAITSNDDQAVKSALTKMLDNYKQVTEDLKNALSKVEATTK